jgi:hypothetical protein
MKDPAKASPYNMWDHLPDQPMYVFKNIWVVWYMNVTNPLGVPLGNILGAMAMDNMI